MRIAVPMMGKEAETLMRQARAIAAHPGVDMAEWRADALERRLRRTLFAPSCPLCCARWQASP